MPDRVTRMQIGHVFSGVNRAGAASEHPYGKIQLRGTYSQSPLAYSNCEG